MSFNIRWGSLLSADGPEGTAADALREILNQKLRTSCPKAIRSLELTHFAFGPTAPLVELTEVGSSRLAQLSDFEEWELGQLSEEELYAARMQQHHNDQLARQAAEEQSFARQQHQQHHHHSHGGSSRGRAHPSTEFDDSASSTAWGGGRGTTASSTATGPTSSFGTAAAAAAARSPTDADSIVSEAEAEDIIGEYVGSDGLFVGLQLKYGGGLVLQGELVLDKTVELSTVCSFGAGIPIGFTVKDVAIDTLLAVDIYRDTGRIWLEPGGGPTEPPVTRMDVAVTIGRGPTAISPQVTACRARRARALSPAQDQNARRRAHVTVCSATRTPTAATAAVARLHGRRLCHTRSCAARRRRQ